MPPVYRADCYRLDINHVRPLFPERRIPFLHCPLCHKRAKAVYVHPSHPDTWKCATCMQFPRSGQGVYRLAALARAQATLEQLALERAVPQVPHEHIPPIPPGDTLSLPQKSKRSKIK